MNIILLSLLLNQMTELAQTTPNPHHIQINELAENTEDVTREGKALAWRKTWREFELGGEYRERVRKKGERHREAGEKERRRRRQ